MESIWWNIKLELIKYFNIFYKSALQKCRVEDFNAFVDIDKKA